MGMMLLARGEVPHGGFFFSSRRRHTRLQGDWSSDVCSSDLVAKSVVRWRDANGSFKSRKQLMEVAGLGAKTFEQSAGFLRIRGGDNPLDMTGVDRKSTRLNSSHLVISYAVFCLKKKKTPNVPMRFALGSCPPAWTLYPPCSPPATCTHPASITASPHTPQLNPHSH